MGADEEEVYQRRSVASRSEQRAIMAHMTTNAKLLLICCLLLVLSACRADSGTFTPTVPLFPTVTAGRVVRASIPPAANPGGSNPATALAAISRPTVTPNLRSCPAPNEALALPAERPPAALLDSTLIQFLDDGGTLVAVETTLRAWGMIGDDFGGTRGDLDLTGEGTPEILLRFAADGEGVLLIAGCLEGRVIDRYRAALTERAPEIISAVDANVSGLPDLLFAAQTCDDDGVCAFRAQMATWQPERGRFVNLISDVWQNDAPPTLEDIEGDRVGEVIARFSSPGDATTGPLRTGFTVWDWDGQSYLRSITQLDPPRFRIQVIHEADAAFAAEAYDQAIPLYQMAADDAALENWLPDDNVILKTYALYRLLLAYSYQDDPRRVAVQGRLLSEYPDAAAAPPYVQMGLEFWDGLQVTNNLRAGCGEAFEVVNARLEAVGLLNRYGDRAPVYDALTLCPF